MGFLTGVITGIGVAAAAAAWYMSRMGERFRDQYRVEQRLGEFGDQFEARTRDLQSTVNAQLTDMRAKGDGASNGHSHSNGHDAVTAIEGAATSQSAVAVEVPPPTDAPPAADAPTTKARKPARSRARDAAG